MSVPGSCTSGTFYSGVPYFSPSLFRFEVSQLAALLPEWILSTMYARPRWLTAKCTCLSMLPQVHHGALLPCLLTYAICTCTVPQLPKIHLYHVPHSPCLGIYVPSPKPGLAHKFSSPLVFSGPPLSHTQIAWGCAMVDVVAQRLYQSCTFHTSTLVIHTALPACLCLCLLSTYVGSHYSLL